MTSTPFPFDLDAPCGDTFTLRALIECGDTWSRLTATGKNVDNVPREPESLASMVALATTVLDPVARALGRPTLSYGFASPSLTRNIKSGIAPALDQHAAAERGRSGTPVCDRGGFAVDFSVDGVTAGELARFIWERTGFDRMYLYARDRPIHVSVSPTPKREVVFMRPTPAGRRVPMVLHHASALANLANVLG